jgi:hypothetical protein
MLPRLGRPARGGGDDGVHLVLADAATIPSLPPFSDPLAGPVRLDRIPIPSQLQLQGALNYNPVARRGGPRR